jgi:serine/threonine-protein kinase
MGLFDKVKGVFGRRETTTYLDVSARFTIDRHAFTGTMSKFHVATEIGTNKKMGIKFLDKEKTEFFKARFKGLNKPSEGQIAMQMHHPRIVETYQFGKTMLGQEYILMEYINGPGLNTLVKHRDERLVANRLKLIRQMGEAVQAVHDAGFIHRDICPRNFICNQKVTWLKLIDFGLSVPNEAPYRLPGNRTGTPQYMAPEIVRRRETDERVDIFAFGVTVYKLLTFEHPWRSTDTSGKAALVHDSMAPDDIREHRPNLNPKLAEMIHKCLAVDPAKRLSSCKLFLATIRDMKTEDVK